MTLVIFDFFSSTQNFPSLFVDKWVTTRRNYGSKISPKGGRYPPKKIFNRVGFRLRFASLGVSASRCRFRASWSKSKILTFCPTYHNSEIKQSVVEETKWNKRLWHWEKLISGRSNVTENIIMALFPNDDRRKRVKRLSFEWGKNVKK